MSVSLTFFMGLGVALDPDKDYYDIVDEHPEYSHYKFENPDADKPGVRLIVDGMCGNYTYLIYVVDTVEQEDMYGADEVAEVPISDFDSMFAELSKAYEVFEGKPLDKSQAKFIRLFHCS